MRARCPSLLAIALAFCLSAGNGFCEDEDPTPGIRNYHLRALKAAGVKADGEGALKFLRSLLPDSNRDPEIARLIKDLGSEKFAQREAAEVGLMRIGIQSVPALRAATKETDEPEIAARAGRLIARVERNRENITPAIVGAFALIAHHKPEGSVAAVIDSLPMLGDEWSASKGRDLLAEIATTADRPVLEAYLKESKAEEDKIAAISGLAAILPETEFKTLEPYMDADQPEAIQLATAHALARRKHRPVLAIFVRLLESDIGTTRWKSSTLIEAFTGKEVGGNPYVEELSAERMAGVKKWLAEEGPTVKLTPLLANVGPDPISGFLASSMSDGVIIFDGAGKQIGKIECSPYDAQALPGGEVLVCDRSSNKVIVFDREGKERRSVADAGTPTDAEMVSDGNILVLENGPGRISEFDLKGKRVWSVDGLSNPFDVDRLPNGNTIVADSGNARLVEFDRAGKVVWEKGELDFPNGVLRLEDGRTLYTTYTSGGVVMLDPAGEQMWERVIESATTYSLAISDGRIYVADGASGQIFILEMDGTISDSIKLDASFVDIGYLRE